MKLIIPFLLLIGAYVFMEMVVGMEKKKFRTFHYVLHALQVLNLRMIISVSSELLYQQYESGKGDDAGVGGLKTALTKSPGWIYSATN